MGKTSGLFLFDFLGAVKGLDVAIRLNLQTCKTEIYYM